METNIETVWEALHHRLRNFILKRVNDENIADDILQDVFLKIHLQMRSLRDADRLEAWVYQIARNAIIDHYRHPNPIVELNEDLSAPELEAPEPNAADEIAASLREMAEALPEPYREALLLTEFQGMSQQQLADRQGLSLSGAKTRVQRARQKIKAALLSCCHFEFDRYGRIVDYWDNCCCCNPGCNTC